MPRRNYPLPNNIPTKRKTHTKNFHQNSIKRNCIASSQKKSRTSFYCRSIFLHCNAFVLSHYNPLIFQKQQLYHPLTIVLENETTEKKTISWGNFVTFFFRGTPIFVTKLPHRHQYAENHKRSHS